MFTVVQAIECAIETLQNFLLFHCYFGGVSVRGSTINNLFFQKCKKKLIIIKRPSDRRRADLFARSKIILKGKKTEAKNSVFAVE